MTAPPPFRALIVDDERLARRELRKLLAAHQDVTVVGEADSAEQAVEQIREQRPDVLFLDIQMPDGSGFDVLDRFDASAHIIFVTAYDRHAIRAFEVNALDYLLKPVHPDRLARAVARLSKPERPPPPSDTPFAYTDRVCLTNRTRMRLLPLREITYIAAAGDYSEVHTVDERTILSSRTLQSWEDVLPAPHFARIHRSTIINLNGVVAIERTTHYAYHVRLRHVEQPLRMSRRYAARFKDQGHSLFSKRRRKSL